ncbi:hypothetical protein FACS1894190_00380 [Spirochaetia bacterium]|nr:hypothetical protein FACS1894190_00380 [Spirochaetia bacterium]
MKKEQHSIENINLRIVKFRHTLNMTQKEFAEKILIATSYLGAIEVGKKKVNDRLVKLITTVFGVSEPWLRTGEGAMFEKDVIPDYKITETVEIFKQLNPFFQDFILDQLRKLLEYERSVSVRE